MGQLAYDLGNAYREAGVTIHNSSLLFWLLQNSPEEMKQLEERLQPDQELNAERLRQTRAYIDRVMAPLAEAEMQDPEAGLIQREFTWAADMLRHACQRGIWMLGQTDTTLAQSLGPEADRLIAEFQEIWSARNRPGGFRESVARMEKIKQTSLGDPNFDHFEE